MKQSTIDDYYLTMAPKGFEPFVKSLIEKTLMSNGHSCKNVKQLGTSINEKNGALEDLAMKIEKSKRKKRDRKRRKSAAKLSGNLCGQGGQNVDFANKLENEKNEIEKTNSDEVDLSRAAGSIHIPDIGTNISLGYHQNEKIVSIPGTVEGVTLMSFQTNAPPIFVASMRGMGCGPLLALVTSSALNSNDSSSDPIPVSSARNSNFFSFDKPLEGAISAMKKITSDCIKDYFLQFERAIQLWQRHANEVWFDPNSIYNLSGSKELQTDASSLKAPQTSIAFRLSCVRAHSKKYSYTREELLQHLVKLVIPWDELHRMDLSFPRNTANQRQAKTPSDVNFDRNIHSESTYVHQDNTCGKKRKLSYKTHTYEWHVDLKNYDFELLTIIHSNCVTIAIPLRPYQHWGSKSYSSNIIPTDGTGGMLNNSEKTGSADDKDEIIGQKGVLVSETRLGEDVGVSSEKRMKDQDDANRIQNNPGTSSTSFADLPKSFLRLRPSTADILIEVAKPPPHSFVLDPCAGVGTIPLRASSCSHFGLGGELSNPLFWGGAPYFFGCHCQHQKRLQKHTFASRYSLEGKAGMIGWDATMLPLRGACVDVIISDIPFGQKCLSTNELSSFLPSFLYQCARVLVPITGKMVLLCGNFEMIISCLKALNDRSSIGKGIKGDVEPNEVIESDSKSCIIDEERDGSAAQSSAVFQFPCDSIFPVNIGGFIAWVVVVHRGSCTAVPSFNFGKNAKKNSILKRSNTSKKGNHSKKY